MSYFGTVEIEKATLRYDTFQDSPDEAPVQQLTFLKGTWRIAEGTADESVGRGRRMAIQALRREHRFWNLSIDSTDHTVYFTLDTLLPPEAFYTEMVHVFQCWKEAYNKARELLGQMEAAGVKFESS